MVVVCGGGVVVALELWSSSVKFGSLKAPGNYQIIYPFLIIRQYIGLSRVGQPELQGRWTRGVRGVHGRPWHWTVNDVGL